MKRAIGRTGVEVNAIGLGAMPMSLKGRPEEAQSIATIHAAIDAGVGLIDTADVYCIDDADIGHNERLIAKALRLKGNPSHVRVATKGGCARPKGAWTTDGRPKHLREACAKSLKALGVESIFLYQLHAPDDAVPFADSVGALAKLQKDGLIQHIGLSNVDAAQLAEALKIVRIESVQNQLNAGDPGDLRSGLVEMCAKEGVTFLAYSPVGGFGGHRSFAKHPLLAELATKHAVSPYRIALAWLLAKSPAILPIPGASKAASIEDSVKAVDVKLDAGDVKRLDALA